MMRMRIASMRWEDDDYDNGGTPPPSLDCYNEEKKGKERLYAPNPNPNPNNPSPHNPSLHTL